MGQFEIAVIVNITDSEIFSNRFVGESQPRKLMVIFVCIKNIDPVKGYSGQRI
jgi:hypothetical protein